MHWVARCSLRLHTRFQQSQHPIPLAHARTSSSLVEGQRRCPSRLRALVPCQQPGGRRGRVVFSSSSSGNAGCVAALPRARLRSDCGGRHGGQHPRRCADRRSHSQSRHLGRRGSLVRLQRRQCSGCSALAWSAGVSDQSALLDTLSGKRGLRVRTAELALAVARQSRADTQRTLESMLRQQYLEAVYNRDALDLAHESQGRLGHVLELNQARFQHGAISQVDALKVETEKLEADQEVERAELALTEAKYQLAFLLGCAAACLISRSTSISRAIAYPTSWAMPRLTLCWSGPASSVPTWPPPTSSTTAPDRPCNRRSASAFPTWRSRST